MCKNFITALLLLPLTIFTGCAVSPAEIQFDGIAVATALNQMAIIVAPVDPTDAADLKIAALGISTATANWTSNSSISILNDAASAAEAVLTRIGQNNSDVALVADLLPIAVAAIDVLVAAAHNQPIPSRAKKLIPHRIGRSPEADLESAWNAKYKSFK